MEKFIYGKIVTNSEKNYLPQVMEIRMISGNQNKNTLLQVLETQNYDYRKYHFFK